MGYVILVVSVCNILLSWLRAVHPKHLFTSNARLKFNSISVIGAVISGAVLAYNTVPVQQMTSNPPPTIKVGHNYLTHKTGKCALQMISIDPTDDIKDLAVDITLSRPAQESTVVRFTDVGRINHYALEYGMDDFCHANLPSVPYARNLAFTLSSDGLHVKIRGKNVNNLDAGAIFVAVPGPVPASEWVHPLKLTFSGEATYSVLETDQAAKLISWDLGTYEYGLKSEEDITPIPGQPQFLDSAPYYKSRWFFNFVVGIIVQILSVCLGWVFRKNGEKRTESLSIGATVGQVVLTLFAVVTLVTTNSASTGLLANFFSKKPTIQIVKYVYPMDETNFPFISEGCTVWGFSVRSSVPVNEFHLVANFEKDIHSYQITDGAEFTESGFNLKPFVMYYPCDQKKTTNPNSQLDSVLSTDRRQVIMYSERFAPYDRGGVILSFYPVRDDTNDRVLAYEWGMNAHYKDWFGNDQKVSTDDIRMIENPHMQIDSKPAL